MTFVDPSFLERLHQVIETHMDQADYSIDQLCRELGVSRTRLFREIKEQTGLSTALYIRQRRLLYAHQLLRTTNLRIAEVGDRVGIPNPSNFSKYFTQHFGESPSTLRRRLAETSAGDTLIDQPSSLRFKSGAQPDPETHLIQETDIVAVRKAARWRGWIWGGSIATATIGFILVWLLYYPTWQRALVLTAQPSIAILPFKNMGPADTESLVEGITDDVHTLLSVVGTLKVIARSSSDHYKGSRKTIWQIGDELQVTNLLKGSVLKNGDHLQIQLELIRTQDDIRIWSKTYEGTYNDLFRLTSRLSQEVAQQLTQPKGESSFDQLTRPRTTNMTAYKAFLLGKQLIHTRSKEKILAGLAKLDEALALDARFVDAYAVKASGYHLLENLGYISSPNIQQLAEQNALIAIRLDSTHSLAYSTLGSVYADQYQWTKAETAFRRALAFNPNDAYANYWYSLLLRAVGRPGDAATFSARALELDPLAPVMVAGHVVNQAYAGQFAQARTTLDQNQLLFGETFLYQFSLGLYAMANNEYGLARRALTETLRLNPGYTDHLPSLLYCQSRLGKTDSARVYLATLPDTNARNAYLKAVVYAGLGDRESCLRSLKKAADGGYIYKDLLLFPPFRSYHQEPIFQAILHQYGLPIKSTKSLLPLTHARDSVALLSSRPPGYLRLISKAAGQHQHGPI